MIRLRTARCSGPGWLPGRWPTAGSAGCPRVRSRWSGSSPPLSGLSPGREYFYRFRTAGHLSPVGRTRTAPAPDVLDQALTMCFVSCSQYEHGWFTAYRRLAAEHPDVILHLGDYQYEHAPGRYVAPSGNVRDHAGPETTRWTTTGPARCRNIHQNSPDFWVTSPAAIGFLRLRGAHRSCPLDHRHPAGGLADQLHHLRWRRLGNAAQDHRHPCGEPAHTLLQQPPWIRPHPDHAW